MDFLRRACLTVIVGAFTHLAGTRAHAQVGPQEMRLHMIDVGQGEAMLLEFPCGAGLIDTGGESNDEFDSTEALINYLKFFFDNRPDLKNRLSFLLLTHPHLDHTRGADQVLKSYKPKNVITNGQTSGSGREGQKAAVAYAAASEEAGQEQVGFETVTIEELPANAGYTSSIIDPIKCASVDPRIQVLWGAHRNNPGWAKKAFDNNNNHSVVVRLDFGATSFLLGGDLEREAIGDMLKRYAGTSLLDVDVYKVGHHGSENATTADLLKAVTPKMAIMAMGSDTRHEQWTAYAYGHPRRKVIDLLQTSVAKTRAAREFPAATAAQAFAPIQITRAIYATGWEGSFVVRATTDGTLERADAGNIPAPRLVNLNQAPIKELMTLPGIGRARAAAIINYRQAHPFKSINDLKNVPSIGPATFQLVKDRISIAE